MWAFIFHIFRFQSTLPQGERLNLIVRILQIQEISIHAPARGATTCYTGICADCFYFNPRSRKGSDESAEGSPLYQDISIHAPARGATRILFCSPSIARKFQSTLPQGERPCLIPAQPLSHIFQSTLPQGERLIDFCSLSISSNFNPRSRKGSDIHQKSRPDRMTLFQSTLPQGERLY